MRRLLVTVVVLLLVVIAVDRISWFLAEREITRRIEASGQVGSNPTAEVAGFPFLTQVAAGKYDRISISAQKVAVQNGLYVDQVSGYAEGIHLSASDALRQNQVPVPVDVLHTEGYISFASLNAAAKSQLGNGLSATFGRASNGKVAVNGKLDSFLGSVDISGEAEAKITGGKLVLSLVPTSLNIPAGIRVQLGSLFGYSYPLPPMPFGLKPESLEVEQDRITFAAGAKDTVIDPSTLEQGTAAR